MDALENCNTDQTVVRDVILKSVKIPNGWNDFPNELEYEFKSPFTIITGRNGVGKTLFLNGIAEGIRRNDGLIKFNLGNGERAELLTLNCQSQQFSNFSDKTQQTNLEEDQNDRANKIHYCSLDQTYEDRWNDLFKDPDDKKAAQTQLKEIQEICAATGFDKVNNKQNFFFSKILENCEVFYGQSLKIEDILRYVKVNHENSFVSKLDTMGFTDSGINSLLSNIGPSSSWNYQLSPGEQVRVICAAFETGKLSFKNRRPIFLLDEFGSHLHLEAEEEFMSTLMECFIKKLEGQIILVTHSPTMVELAPKHSDIVLMRRCKKSVTIKKVEKVEATTNISTRTLIIGLAICHVLCEAESDVMFYNYVSSLLKRNNTFCCQLSFCSVGKSDKNSDCKFVRRILETISEGRQNSDTKYCFAGILDLDETTVSDTDEKMGLLKHKRYSLENYLFDPLNIFLFFNNVPKWFEKSGIKEEIKDVLKNKTIIDNGQEIANFFFEKLRSLCINKLSEEKKKSWGMGYSLQEDETETVKYTMPLQLDYPVWFLHIRGHYLEKLYGHWFGDLTEKDIEFNEESNKKDKIWNTKTILNSTKGSKFKYEMVVSKDLEELIFKLGCVK